MEFVYIMHSNWIKCVERNGKMLKVNVYTVYSYFVLARFFQLASLQ